MKIKKFLILFIMNLLCLSGCNSIPIPPVGNFEWMPIGGNSWVSDNCENLCESQPKDSIENCENDCNDTIYYMERFSNDTGNSDYGSMGIYSPPLTNSQ